MPDSQKKAVILFNLGGPDSLTAVPDFLYNLFSDPAIFRLPSLVRKPLAYLVSRRRTEEASEIYRALGGCSPLLSNTQAQAQALEKTLPDNYKVFICMRYWHPRAEDVVRQVKDFCPTHITLLPLYPQFSTTTTASSFNEWYQEASRQNVHIPTTEICCYPEQDLFVEEMAKGIEKLLLEFPDPGNVKLLFSAHGLPQRVVDGGDPYQAHVEATTQAVLKKLKKPYDHINCYQSRVGPVEWLKPYTDKVIEDCGRVGKDILLIPVSFVSEHSETLYELDIQYRELAQKVGVSYYRRLGTVSTSPGFIKGLSELVLNPPVKRFCSHVFCQCWYEERKVA